jgi:hypothetical protein
MLMMIQENVKRTSLYIPLELATQVKQSAKLHRRSFNQEILWLAEQGLSGQEKTPDQVTARSGVVKAKSL